jgi:hypothetical protein
LQTASSAASLANMPLLPVRTARSTPSKTRMTTQIRNLREAWNRMCRRRVFYTTTRMMKSTSRWMS